MSFSSETKSELSKQEEKKPCCIISELASMVYSSAKLILQAKNEFTLNFDFELPTVTRRCFSHIRQLYGQSPQIMRKKHQRFGGIYSYSLLLDSYTSKRLLSDINMLSSDGQSLIAMSPQYVPQKTCCKRAFIKAAFISAGSLQHPIKGYHIEIISYSEQYIKLLKRLIKSFGIEFKQQIRRDSIVLYLKKSENISDFLALTGANKAVMELEDLLVKRQVLNNINRAMNCDSSNINKQIKAALKQVDDIKLIQKNHEVLEHSLQVLANLRLKNPELNLEQLGLMLKPPLSKSGVNHRLKKISNIADKYR